MTSTTLVLLLFYFASFALLAFFSLHRLWLLFLLRRHPVQRALCGLGAPLPRVTVQLPVFNERFVVERLLAAVERLDYPSGLLDIQVLDDSVDDTRATIARCVATMRAHGLVVQHVTRASRHGYKAGALAHGLATARGEFILILDADFVPQPSLIRDLLAPMSDARVGMVQARWGHLNRNANALTRAQALLLDAHFLLETAARARAACFFNFHGTAGLWRRSAIEASGGWSSQTLTEDLDLSYRAQLAGWKFVYLDDVVVPAELPSTLAAFRQQQARWAQGTIATARKLLPSIVRASLPWQLKAEAIVHLTCHTIYPATVVVAVTGLPVLLLRRSAGLQPLFWLDLILALSVIVPTRIFYRRAAHRAGTRPPGIRQMPFLMLTGIALSLSNSRAVLAGLLGRDRVFERTPKAGTLGVVSRYRVRTSSLLRSLDGSLAAYLLLAAGVAAGHGLFAAVPGFALVGLAFALAALKG